jgi:LPS-assembly lipoprotein
MTHLKAPPLTLRLGLAALALMALSGCGFHPMYGPSLSPQLSSIYVDPIAERDGYELRNSLIDLLGSNGETRGKRYRLTITLRESNQGVALRNDSAITRYNDTLAASFVLTDMNGAKITEGTQSGLTAYNVTSSPYATLAAQQDADKRAAQDIAERIRLDLAAFFRQRR